MLMCLPHRGTVIVPLSSTVGLSVDGCCGWPYPSAMRGHRATIDDEQNDRMCSAPHHEPPVRAAATAARLIDDALRGCITAIVALISSLRLVRIAFVSCLYQRTKHQRNRGQNFPKGLRQHKQIEIVCHRGNTNGTKKSGDGHLIVLFFCTEGTSKLAVVRAMQTRHEDSASLVMITSTFDVELVKTVTCAPNALANFTAIPPTHRDR